MNLDLDHVFILCAAGAPEARALTDLGLIEGSSNRHPGQGTACRRFFFDSWYLELLWVEDAQEAQREPARRVGLWERWTGRASGGCPFGVILRPGPGAPDSPPPPFPAWSYQPAYFPAGLSIDVSSDASPTEPLFFWLPFQRNPARLGLEPTKHLVGATVMSVRLTLPEPPRSAAAAAAVDAGVLVFAAATEYLLDVTFEGSSGYMADVRPTLPLRLCW